MDVRTKNKRLNWVKLIILYISIFVEHKMIYLFLYYAFNIAVTYELRTYTWTGFRTISVKQHAAEIHSAHLSQRKSVYKTCHAFSLHEREMEKYIELKCAHIAKLDVWQNVWVQIFYFFIGIIINTMVYRLYFC